MEDNRRRRAVARLSTEYVACLLSEGVSDTGLDVLDFAIVLVAGASNIGHLAGKTDSLMGDPLADAPVPPDLMAPVTVIGIAESLKLPLELARQRIDALVARGLFAEIAGRGVIISNAVTSSGTAERLADKNVAMAGRFVRQLADIGVTA